MGKVASFFRLSRKANQSLGRNWNQSAQAKVLSLGMALARLLALRAARSPRWLNSSRYTTTGEVFE
jgi:hypothetical protein